ETADGSNNVVSGASDTEAFIVSGLPNSAFSIVHNRTTTVNSTTPAMRATSMAMHAANGTVSWQYPTSGTRSGTVMQVAGLAGSSILYDCGTETATGPEFVDQLNATGGLIWHHRFQPADQILPWSDGFFTSLRSK